MRSRCKTGADHHLDLRVRRRRQVFPPISSASTARSWRRGQQSERPARLAASPCAGRARGDERRPDRDQLGQREDGRRDLDQHGRPRLGDRRRARTSSENLAAAGGAASSISISGAPIRLADGGLISSSSSAAPPANHPARPSSSYILLEGRTDLGVITTSGPGTERAHHHRRAPGGDLQRGAHPGAGPAARRQRPAHLELLRPLHRPHERALRRRHAGPGQPGERRELRRGDPRHLLPGRVGGVARPVSRRAQQRGREPASPSPLRAVRGNRG